MPAPAVIVTAGEIMKCAGYILTVRELYKFLKDMEKRSKQKENNVREIKEIENTYAEILGSIPAARQQIGYLIEATSKYTIDFNKLAN